MSPAGAGVAAYRRARDWSRARRAAGYALAMPIFVYLCLVAAIMVVGIALSVVYIVVYGFGHAPILTGAILAAWLLYAVIATWFDGRSWDHKHTR